MTARDLAFERERTADAARLVTAVAPDRLVEFSELRAGAGPVRDLDRRDFGRETLEELADARNYACWWVHQTTLRQDADSDIHAALAQAITWTIAHTAAAFQHATDARDLSVDLRNA